MTQPSERYNDRWQALVSTVLDYLGKLWETNATVSRHDGEHCHGPAKRGNLRPRRSVWKDYQANP